ncbi:MAG: glutamine synthetase [Neisseriaceae bacterium]|nr:glutamine synthetase [Neisseriaceae bacterium]
MESTARHTQALLAEITARGLSHVKVGFFDLEGVLVGKYVSTEKFTLALSQGLSFCDVVMGWDVNDALLDNIRLTGWASGYGDAQLTLLPAHYRVLPLEGDQLFVPGQLAGRLAGICPRNVLLRVLETATQMGFNSRTGFEYEFLVLDEPHEALRAKQFTQPKPLGEGAFGYSMLRTAMHHDFYEGLLALCAQMKMPIESIHEETGPGMMEAALAVTETSLAADNAALFKTFSKAWAHQQGRMLSFMAKWHPDYSGQGGHLHISLQGLDGTSAFYDAAATNGISQTMRWFIGGLQQLSAEFMCLFAPNINSYRRLVPGYWAPTTALWGIDNRTVAIRAITGGPSSQRIEFRVPGADANPYLAVAGVLAAGLHGIRHQLEPDAPISGNAYAVTVPEARVLPRTLWDAAQRLRGSEAAIEAFGADFVDHFASMKEWEEREFQRHVSDWELARYFEII